MAIYDVEIIHEGSNLDYTKPVNIVYESKDEDTAANRVIGFMNFLLMNFKTSFMGSYE